MEKFFAIKVKGGDLSSAGVLDGETVVLRRQAYARDGKLILALFNNKLLLRFYREAAGCKYLLGGGDCLPVVVRESDKFKILGEAEELRRSF
jgi:SOS-response transcriptional repressor LexA